MTFILVIWAILHGLCIGAGVITAFSGLLAHDLDTLTARWCLAFIFFGPAAILYWALLVLLLVWRAAFPKKKPEAETPTRG